MGRSTLIAVLGAVVVGSTAGGLAALQLAHRTPRAGTPLSASAPPPAPAVLDAGAAPAPDPRSVVATQMKALLARFVEWTSDHAGAPCPDVAALGATLVDPWGRDLGLTCTDQPADQMIGAISVGPDGIAGNDDDITSWTLGSSITSLVRGPRWKSAPAGRTPQPAKPLTTRRRPIPPPSPPPSKPAGAPADAATDDIPVRR